MKRKRKCQECGKPLASTLGKCYECGGDNYRAGGTTMYREAYRWKIAMGLEPSKVRKAHQESNERRNEEMAFSPRVHGDVELAPDEGGKA